jgi:hypothetical protein
MVGPTPRAPFRRNVLRRSINGQVLKKPGPRHIWLLPQPELQRISRVLRRGEGDPYMRYERAYTRRQRAVTFTRSSTRTVTIPMNAADFERLERLAAKHNIGNATLGREIIRKYLKRQADDELA